MQRFPCTIATVRCWRVTPMLKRRSDGISRQASRQQTLFTSDHDSARLTSPVDGRDRLVSARTLANFPIVVVASTTISAALGEWREQTRFLIAVAGLFVLVITTMLFLVIRKLSQQHRMEKQRLDTAINNMTQGLLLFDSSQRLVVCNQRYLEMYGLSAEILKPGCTFREVVAHRKATGSFERQSRRILFACSAGDRTKKFHGHRHPGRSFNSDHKRTVDGWRMGGDPRGYHRAHARRGAHQTPRTLRRADRPAKPRIVSRTAETGARSYRSGRATGGTVYRHRRIQERQRFARTYDRRRIAEIRGRAAWPVHRRLRLRRTAGRRRIRHRSDRGQGPSRSRRPRHAGISMRSALLTSVSVTTLHRTPASASPWHHRMEPTSIKS